ncbi:MAG: hypothetical protein AAFR21_02300 [Pseudomonadota bacterium]
MATTTPHLASLGLETARAELAIVTHQFSLKHIQNTAVFAAATAIVIAVEADVVLTRGDFNGLSGLTEYVGGQQLGSILDRHRVIIEPCQGKSGEQR